MVSTDGIPSGAGNVVEIEPGYFRKIFQKV